MSTEKRSDNLSRNNLDLRNNGIAIKRVTINDHSQLPKDFCTTPGGTFFSTTPGGTRIIYDRSFLLSRKESPLAKSPPANLPYIPEITLIPPKDNNCKNLSNNGSSSSTESTDFNHNSNQFNKNKKDEEDTFEMDI